MTLPLRSMCKVFTVFSLIFAFEYAQASSEIDDEFKSMSVARLPHTDASSIAPSGWSLIVPSFVVHGTEPDGSAAQAMPRKIDGSGNSVLTPGIGLQFEDSSSFMLFLAVLKDCYDDLAGAVQIGQSFSIGQTSRWGYTVGIYARETPLSCTRQVARNGQVTTDCESLDSYDWKFMTVINNEFFDIIPMPFLHFSTPLYSSRNFTVQLKIASNVILNEVGIAIPF